MIRGVLVFLFFAGAAAAEADLGPYARPGVPVLIEGRLHYPNALPWKHTDGDVFEAVATGRILVGYAGMEPWTPDGVRIRLPAARGLWPALDVFDRIVLPRAAACTDALKAWVRAGGDLVVTDRDPLDGDHGLGRASIAASAAEAPPPRPLLIPPPGLARPDVYDLLPPPGGPAPALGRARQVFWAVAAVLALHFLLWATGRLQGRTAQVGLVLLVVAGTVLGLTIPGAAHTPTARGYLAVRWLRGGWARERIYHFYGYMGPGSVWPGGGGALVYYGANREEWPESLEAGITRLVREDRIVRAEATLPLVESVLAARRERPVVRLLKRARPRGAAWRVGASRGVLPPGARDRELARLEVVLTD